jgi:hypothetical protein
MNSLHLTRARLDAAIKLGVGAFAGICLSACANTAMTDAHDFAVQDSNLSASVHVGGGELGASAADLDTMIKDGVACGLQTASHADPGLEGKKLELVWSVNGLARPEISTVSLHATADGLPTEAAVERISLQQAPRAMFVKAVCGLTADSLTALHRDAVAMAGSGSSAASK